MNRKDIKNIFVVIKRKGIYREHPKYPVSDVEENLLYDHQSRIPVFWNEYEAIKLAKRIGNCIVRKIEFSTFDWGISNSGKTIFIDSELIK